MHRLFSAVLLALLLAPAAFPWGAQGHAAIATLARERLSPTARKEIQGILGSDDLPSIASWMDQVLGVPKNFGPLAADPEAHAFSKDYPHSFFWHFVDIPLDQAAYTDDSPFARPDDVVHQINLAIDVLEGRSSVVSQRVALYMLVHFVGDMHQPLHVACGFYDLTDPAHPVLLTSPKAALGKPSDEGGNDLVFGDNKFDELHTLWDSGLPRQIAGGPEVAALADKLRPTIDPAAWASQGDYRHWAEQWATQSILAAREVYAGITLGQATLENGKLKSIRVRLPEGYAQDHLALAQRRMAQAGYHLAELLNSIHWKDSGTP